MNLLNRRLIQQNQHTHKNKEAIVATENISEEYANDSDESTPTCPSDCEWDSGYEFPDDRKEESVIDSDANNVLSTPRSL